MSREFLTDILNKFAQVTSILVETSKIKEDLDHKTAVDLKDIVKRTENQIDSLLEHASSLKDFFSKHQKTIDRVNGKDVNENSSVQTDLSSGDFEKTCNGNDSSSQTNKPLIKLVDIKKLVEPRALIKQTKKSPEKHTHLDESVVIITSSDEEAPKTSHKKYKEATTKKSSKKPSDSLDIRIPKFPNKTYSSRSHCRRKAAEKTMEKTKMFLQDSDSELEEVGTKTNKNGKRKTLDDVKLNENSCTTSETDSNSTKSSDVRKRRDKTNKNRINDETQLDWKSDLKFNSKCYVKVLRVPCEKLKEYYLEKLELLEINKLQDLASLKRKRRHSGSTTSKEENKTTRKSKPVNRKESSDSESSNDVDISKSSVSPVIPNNIENPQKTNSEANDDAAEEALAHLSSDNENDSHSSVEETDKGKQDPPQEKEEQSESEKNKEKDGTNTNNGDNENEETQEKNSSKNDLPSNKDAENSEKEKDTSTDKTDEVVNNSVQAEEQLEQDKESDDEETKKRKKWRNDPLLRVKLSSSDSEEELRKFKKNKEKLNESTSDQPQMSKDQKKRCKKRRIKKAIISDSDSDSKKNSSNDNENQSDSDSSSSTPEEKPKEPEKPKRKRVKRVQDSSEDEEGKSTRKQIRHILDRDSLAETTKQAEAEERERKARVAEKQKKYNQIYELGAQDAKVENIVLDYDEKNSKELLKVDEHFVAKLKPHQASGIQFMWDACFESLERANSTKGSGCILAHCMGLGKTLQVITLCHTLLVNSEQTNVKKILVVCPLNTVLNWVNEFKQWLPDQDDFDVFELVSFKQNFERQYEVKSWHAGGGVLIIGYDMFRNLSNPENKRISKKMRGAFQEALVDPGPDLVICDEGHLLKNEKTGLSIAMNRIRTLRRIILTGTPLQNNLKEYFCMVQFIKPNLLGTYKEYLNRFVNPIINGQYTDSTPHDIQVMRKRSHVLHKMLDGVVQRRDYSVLEPYLPPKFEYVLFLKLSEVQLKLYQHYMDHFAQRSTDGTNRTSFLFVDFQALQRICTHPRVLLDKSIEMKLAKENQEDSEESEGSLKDFIDDDEEEESSGSNSSSDNDIQPAAPRKRMTRAAAATAEENGEKCDFEVIEQPQAKEWWQEYCDGDELDVINHGSKLFMLFEILKECEQIGDKVLVFSQSLYSLNVIEYFMEKIHEATQAGNTDSVNGYSGSWCSGLDYFRLDGSSSCDNRNQWCKIFNDPENTRARLFLISTRAGGLGINLFAANRVIIFDVSWNPSHDLQSIYRVYRFGQTKPTYVYRFVTLGTMEMKVYERQVTKQAISKRVIDEQQIDRHYNQNDLAELYKFEPDPGERPIPLVPKDILLGELLQKFEDRLYKYHEHQTLLENKEDEVLNEEERKAAWEEFENEKKQRNYLGGTNIRFNNLDLALMNLLRKENPSWNEIQIRSMVPTLHAQMQEQVVKGDLTLYRRVQQEMQIIVALQNQKFKDQQQQMLRVIQQRQMLEALKYHGIGNPSEHFMNANQMAGTSRGTNSLNSSNIIELND